MPFLWCRLLVPSFRMYAFLFFWTTPKGQLISKASCQALNSSKKRTNEFVFTTMRCVLVPFLEEIEDTRKTFQNCLTIILLLFCNYFMCNSLYHLVWPQWRSFADVSQQGKGFSKKISKIKMFFLIWLSQMFTRTFKN